MANNMKTPKDFATWNEYVRYLAEEAKKAQRGDASELGVAESLSQDGQVKIVIELQDDPKVKHG